MTKIGNARAGGPASAQPPWDGYSRRSFLGRVGLLGMGSAVLTASTAPKAQAQYGPGSLDDLSKEQLVKMYEDMLKIRLWESKVKDLLLAGGFRGVAHLYVGEEAIATGVCHALRKDDYITSTHRGHGHCLAKGAGIDRMFAELLGKEAGYCHGKGGSMHIADLGKGMLGANGILGAGAPLVCGSWA